MVHPRLVRQTGQSATTRTSRRESRRSNGPAAPAAVLPRLVSGVAIAFLLAAVGLCRGPGWGVSLPGCSPSWFSPYSWGRLGWW
jgi:hypothetical protein